MRNDIVVAWRMLRKSPGFTLTAVLTLAIAIGANTAVFSVVDAVLLRPLPYPEPDRLGHLTRAVIFEGVAETAPVSAHTGAVWEAVRDGATTVRAAVYSTMNPRVNLSMGDRAVAVRQQRVGAGYVGVLGAGPALGREFTADEDVPNGPAVTILSDGLWRRLTGGDPGVIGRTILLRGEPHTVVGVMPASFRGAAEADLWTPLRPTRDGEGSGANYAIVVRLAPGADWPRARAELAAAADPALPTRVTARGAVVTHDVVPLHDALTFGARRTVLLLWAAVALVLVVAAVNLAGLLLARAGARTREIATRLALGGGRSAIVRQLLVESLMLAAIGGGVGLVVGAAGLGVLNDLAGRLYDAPWIDGVTLEWRGVALTLAVTGLTAVAFGLVPALHASRLDVTRALAEGGTRAIAGGTRGLARRSLIVAEVALGVVLLVGAGLLLRTFLALDRAEPGFDAAPLVTASASLDDARYAEADAVVRLFDDSVRRLEAQPGVMAAAVSLGLPYQRVLNMPFTLVGGADDDIKVANTTYVTPGYFDALGQPVLAGRPIGAEDTASGAPVAVVNETFVRLFLDGRDPLATAVRLGDVERRIVGVTTDVQQAAGFMGYGPIDALPQVYLPVAQVSGAFLRQVHVWFAPAWIVRQATPGALTERAFVETMRAADPHLPMTALRGIDEVRAEALGRQRLRTWLVGLLAVVALLLTAIGIHGLIASGVTERLREIGIRLALGATTGEAIREVAAPGVRLAVAGVAVGCVAALGATRFLRSLLWGVSETDTTTYVVVAVTLVAVAVVASVGPALRIRRLDPMGVLRD